MVSAGLPLGSGFKIYEVARAPWPSAVHLRDKDTPDAPWPRPPTSRFPPQRPPSTSLAGSAPALFFQFLLKGEIKISPQAPRPTQGVPFTDPVTPEACISSASWIIASHTVFKYVEHSQRHVFPLALSHQSQLDIVADRV